MTTGADIRTRVDEEAGEGPEGEGPPGGDDIIELDDPSCPDTLKDEASRITCMALPPVGILTRPPADTPPGRTRQAN